MDIKTIQRRDKMKSKKYNPNKIFINDILYIKSSWIKRQLKKEQKDGAVEVDIDWLYHLIEG